MASVVDMDILGYNGSQFSQLGTILNANLDISLRTCFIEKKDGYGKSQYVLF